MMGPGSRNGLATRSAGPCRVLRSADEIRAAELESERLGLCPVPDASKHWDNLIAVEAVRQSGVGLHEPIVDLGCRGGIVLTWLHQLGYRSLYGCDLRAPYPGIRGAARKRLWRTAYWGARMYLHDRSRMRRVRVEATGFPSGAFAAATCMSVIEHGVEVPAFLREASRLLRPGGLLVLSTDYWPEPIDLEGLQRYESAHGRDRILSREEVEEICREAESHGLLLAEPVDLDAGARVIRSAGYEYTFLALAFRREESTAPA